MTVYQLRGYPNNFYFVKTYDELLQIFSWAQKNDVRCLYECSSAYGYGFSVKDTNDRALLILSWL